MFRRMICLFAVVLLFCSSALGDAFFAPKPNKVQQDAESLLQGELPKTTFFDFPGEFLEEGEEILHTDTEYQSQNIHLTLTQTRVDKTDVIIAEVYLRRLDCLVRLFGNDTYASRSTTVRKYAAATEGILCMSGDSGAALYGGLVVGNGKVWQNIVNKKRDQCVIWKNGLMECFTGTEMREEGIYSRENEIWQTFFFGPRVLGRNGEVLEKKSQFSYTDVWVKNPRAVIGSAEPGHYFLVLVAGRSTQSQVDPVKKNYGLDLCQVSQLMADLGCTAAYTLDGGQSAVLWYNGDVISPLVNGGRPVGDAILIREPGTDMEVGQIK